MASLLSSILRTIPRGLPLPPLPKGNKSRRVIASHRNVCDFALSDPSPPPLPHLAVLMDDVLAEILLIVPSPRDLGRPSASCSSFRRVISNPHFLRRFVAVHAPPPLGVFCCYPTWGGGVGGSQFHAALPSHPLAALARALASSADFCFSSLPSAASDWLVRDCCFLLDHVRGGSTAFTEVAISDPLFRRYCLLPPIPNNLTASVENPYVQRGSDGQLQSRSSEIFLVSRSDDSVSENDMAFTVILMACCRGKLVAFFYSSESQQWCALSPPV